MLAMALCMTGSDLNSSSKPWTVQFRTAKIVYAEFHEQGDVEKALGWKPIPLFDRDNYPELASMQVSLYYLQFVDCGAGWIFRRDLYSMLRSSLKGDAFSNTNVGAMPG